MSVLFRKNKQTAKWDLRVNGRTIASYWLHEEMIKARDALLRSNRRPLQDFLDTRYDHSYESFRCWIEHRFVNTFAQYTRKRFQEEMDICNNVGVGGRSGLSQEELKELLHYDPDTGLIVWKVSLSSSAYCYRIAGCNVRGSICITIHGRVYKAHQLAWLYVYGVWSDVHHINGNKMDNRIANLRDVPKPTIDDLVKEQRLSRADAIKRIDQVLANNRESGV